LQATEATRHRAARVANRTCIGMVCTARLPVGCGFVEESEGGCCGSRVGLQVTTAMNMPSQETELRGQKTRKNGSLLPR
jgi:hypothetical protein